MFDRIRDIAATGLLVLARRLTREDRYAASSRVANRMRTLAGVIITPDTAVTMAAVWACLRYLSQTVAVLPWRVMRETAKGAEIQRSHPVDWLIWKRASAEWSSFQFRETLTHWALRWGNGYAEIEADQLGRPFAMWPIHPERVEVCRATEDSFDDAGNPIPAGSLFYEVNNGTDTKAVLAPKRMFHVRGFGEGPVGVNVIHYASQSLGWGLAAQLYGATFFGNGATPATVVVNKKPLTTEGLVKQKAEFAQLFKGPRNSNRTAHVDADTDIKTIGVNAKESQLIETHQHLVEEVCRWFGVPPHKVMHLLRATFSNIEHQAIEVVVDSVSPWVKRFEDEADYKFFGQNRSAYYTKMNMRALMRGDSAGRAAFYKQMFDMGAYSPNRILELEDENTIGPDGDKHLVQLNLTTLDKAGEQPQAQQPPRPAPANDDEPADDELDSGDDAAVAAGIARIEALLQQEHTVEG